MSPAEIQALLQYMTRAERAEIQTLLTADTKVWRPLPGPQSLAYWSTADIVGYGGAAGGGKTDLAIGKALTQHQRTLVVRLNGTENTAMVDRLADIFGTVDHTTGNPPVCRVVTDGVARQIELIGVPNKGDEAKYRGRPHDLKIFDEASEIPESRIRFLMGWMRTTTLGQRCQALLCFNPPTTVEGRWIIQYFAPWLDETHPVPALPGEIRWFGSMNGKDYEVPDNRKFVLIGPKNDQRPCFEFNPKDYKETDIVTPLSRTFIPSKVTDNPYLMGTGYMATLQAMPEPLRSQMLNGDFKAGMEDDPWQVIPTEWVEAAMARWKPREPKPEMDSLGVDVARGGKDNTIISRRHGWWFDDLLVYPGKQTPDGPTVAGLTIAATRDGAPQHIDIIGVGASPYDFLRQAKQQVLGVNVAEATAGKDRSGRLSFSNLRSELWWRMRELLDPTNNYAAELPNDRQLLLDLCAPKWSLTGPRITVQSREEMIKTLGRSPDYGSAVCLAAIETPKMSKMANGVHNNGVRREHDPFANLNARGNTREHDPFAKRLN